MQIGVPKETKNHEYRVGLAPSSVREIVSHGHQIVVEQQAGEGIGASDADYRSAGATVTEDVARLFNECDMIVKVKEPQADEREMLREGQILFTYLHLAPDPEQTEDLVKSGATCIAYETVTSPHGGLPLLAPMSKVAGRMAIQAGAHRLEQPHGGPPSNEAARASTMPTVTQDTHSTHPGQSNANRHYRRASACTIFRSHH